MIWNFIDMQCHVFKTILTNWRKLKLNRFYRMRNSKLENIVTKMVEIQVSLKDVQANHQKRF